MRQTGHESSTPRRQMIPRLVSLGCTAALALSVGLVGTVVTPEPAHALYEVCNPYSLQDFRDQMAAMEKAFEDFDLNEARYQAETAEKYARCINEPVTPEDVARFAIDRAQMYYFDSKTDSAAEWMLVALTATGGRLPEEIGEEHPLRLVLREVMIEDLEKVSYDGHALPPKKGGVLINGRLVQQPTGFNGVKQLVQIFDKKGEYVEGFWLTGADWGGDTESTFVSADAGEYKTPSWYSGPGHDTAPDLHKAVAIVTGMEVEPDIGEPDGTGTGDPVVTDGGTTDPPDGTGTDGQDTTGQGADTGDGTGSTGDGTGLVEVPPPDQIKPPKDPKGPKPPKPPGNGPNTGLLSTGLGVAALGGALWGIGAAINGSDPAPGYTGDQLAARRTTINALGTSGAGLVVVGVGLFSVSMVSDGPAIRLGRRF